MGLIKAVIGFFFISMAFSLSWDKIIPNLKSSNYLYAIGWFMFCAFIFWIGENLMFPPKE